MKTILKAWKSSAVVLCLLLLLVINAGAQDRKRLEPITLYNINGKAETCEDNLKNLFKAWNTENISNADQFKLLSYKSLGVIKDSLQAKKYIELITKIDYPFLNPESYSSSENKKRTITLRLYSYEQDLVKAPEQRKNEVRQKIDKMLSEVRARLETRIKPGLEVYSVQMEHEGKAIEFLVFCDPQTKQVVVDLAFQNIVLGYNE